jgi:regulator of protease activity HflC (stomatin/prohibitin superfamily)
MLIFLLTTVGCEKVEPGWAAVKVNQYGGARGVQKEPITTGVVWYWRPMHDLYQFPTFTQTANWTKDSQEGSEGDDSVTMNSTEGAAMNTDISLAYHFELEKVPSIFESFRRDAEGLTHTYVLARIRDHFNRVASTMTASDILGPGKVKFLTDVKIKIKEELDPRGIIVEDISFYGDMRIDERVRQSVNAVIEARQLAERARQQVEQEKAEADKKIQQARGVAESKKLVADAEAYANRALSESISDRVMQFRSLEKWNGVLPLVIGGSTTPFITIPQK